MARDSVRDDTGNDELVAGIGELIVAALPAMRDADLITDGLLEALPDKRDDLPDRYDVLRTKIIEAFDSEKLTPMAGGGHAPAIELWRSDYASVRSALSVDDADFLWSLTHSGNEWEPSPGWLRSAEGRAKAFLDSLTAPNFNRDLLTRAIREVARWNTTTDPRLNRWTSWLAAKPTTGCASSTWRSVTCHTMVRTRRRRTCCEKNYAHPAGPRAPRHRLQPRPAQRGPPPDSARRTRERPGPGLAGGLRRGRLRERAVPCASSTRALTSGRGMPPPSSTHASRSMAHNPVNGYRR